MNATVTVVLDSPTAVVEARRAARDFARDGGLGLLDQTRFATAVSEIARNAVLYADRGELELTHQQAPTAAVVARVRDEGPGIDDLDAVLQDRYESERGLGRGLSGTRALVDVMNVDTSSHGTVVEIVKYLGRRTPATPKPTTTAPPTVRTGAHDPLQDLRDQNEALLETINTLVTAERALAASEKRLALALDVAQIGTLEWRRDGSARMDERCRQQHGIAIDADIDRDMWIRHVHPDDRETLQSNLSAVMGGSSDALEYRTASGRWLAARLYADDAETEDGAGLATILDVTDRRRAEEQSREQVRFQQQLIGIVSHDLRSPLQVVTTAATLLGEFGPLNEGQAKTVSRINSSVERATRLVQDLLDFAKSSLGGRLPIALRRMDLGQLANHIVNETQSLDELHVVELVTRGDLTGEWDADRLAQILTNLLHNAFTYSPAHTTVTVTAEAMGERQVRLSVHNTGDPVPEAVLPHLFEPLGQRRHGAHGPRNMGLGLYIVRAVALAHGGEASASSSNEDGTRIDVVLPRQSPTTL